MVLVDIWPQAFKRLQNMNILPCCCYIVLYHWTVEYMEAEKESKTDEMRNPLVWKEKNRPHNDFLLSNTGPIRRYMENEWCTGVFNCSECQEFMVACLFTCSYLCFTCYLHLIIWSRSCNKKGTNVSVAEIKRDRRLTKIFLNQSIKASRGSTEQ